MKRLDMEVEHNQRNKNKDPDDKFAEVMSAFQTDAKPTMQAVQVCVGSARSGNRLCRRCGLETIRPRRHRNSESRSQSGGSGRYEGEEEDTGPG